MMLKMPTIEERQSEYDNQEELARKRGDYEKKITRITSEVQDLKRTLEQMQRQNEEHKGKLVKKEAREMLKEREQHLGLLEGELLRVQAEA
jgi:septal ring factor EnvC (AmiA/AmiB activator)